MSKERTPQNDAQAIYWYRKAAEKLDLNAPYYLGRLLMFSKQITANYAEAAH
jgi:TPR repeat protein